MKTDGGLAHLGGQLATGLTEVSHDPSVLERSGRWAVVVTFEGAVTCARFDRWERRPLPEQPPWRGPRPQDWSTSLDQHGYVGAVRAVREMIAAGTVYQVNVCRVMSAALPEPDGGLAPLAALLQARHTAPHAGLIDVPGLRVATASPELFLRRSGDHVVSSPIKGTGRTFADLSPKDSAENVMIVDLVRNDLSRVCVTGSIAVDALLSVEHHPGLVHLVSTVSGTLRPGAGWPELFDATFPPGSVTGAPKSSALRAITDLEPAARGPYCGAVGWVDADTGEGELAVGIRTFWADDGMLRFGTGAGITWGSDPEKEWAETELKAERLVGLASCSYG
ncbi:para-aminobenzoate synthetase component 1 [Haloactinopolyspora alba]|uniref:Para-aminobenzoate synthetase component 1 n=1 Tax=Haloactinopolyspora alba TaxID=648780 RepID=A0A2P8DIH5_9ACTN|nr:chorismate-binding protein [Haloactinopolyspora alba]PSK96959.1 para-aminobenzoate synthetase component 1 [Haloactinopolyspora alba]